MQQYIRFYVLVHGYFLGVAALALAPISLLNTYRNGFSHIWLWHLEMNTHLAWIGAWRWLISILWLTAGGSFLYGIRKHEKRALLPVLPLLGVHMVLTMIDDVLELLEYADNPREHHSYTPFLYINSLLEYVYVMLHVSITIVLLGFLCDKASNLELKGTELRTPEDITEEVEQGRETTNGFASGNL